MSTRLPPTVEQFVAASIPSVLHLEALLFLRARKHEETTPDVVARALYVEAAAAVRVLDDLVRQQLVRIASPGTFRFDPATPELRERVEELEATYRERLVPLHEFIHERVTQGGLQDFANAFRIRKD